MEKPPVDTAVRFGQSDDGRGQYARSVFEEYYDRLYSYVASIVRDFDMARDAMQDLFVRILRRPERFASAKPQLPYLLSAARNIAYDHLRKRSKQSSREYVFEGEFEVLTMASDADGDVDDHRLNRANRALQHLPEEQYETVILKLFQDLTFDEISEIVGVPARTCQSRYRSAIQKLQEKMTNE